MKTISREELKEKLDRKDNFQLVMTLGEAAGSISHCDRISVGTR